nr:hypothetical protein CFP56_02843 [Quercus suber]
MRTWQEWRRHASVNIAVIVCGSLDRASSVRCTVMLPQPGASKFARGPILQLTLCSSFSLGTRPRQPRHISHRPSSQQLYMHEKQLPRETFVSLRLRWLGNVGSFFMPGLEECADAIRNVATPSSPVPDGRPSVPGDCDRRVGWMACLVPMLIQDRD